MPIRTHRGRAAVYRRLWGWPVRSPRHLAGTVLTLAVIAFGIGQALPPTRQGPQTVGPPPGTHRSHSVPVPLGGSPREGTAAVQLWTGQVSAPAPAAAIDTARSWVHAFLTVGRATTPARWVEQLRPYSTDELLPQLRTVDPANVPAGRITGEPRTVSTSASSAEIDVPTSALVVRVLVVATPSGWRVAGYQQAG